MARLNRIKLLAHGPGEPVPLQRLGPQLEDQRPHLRQTGLSEVLDVGERFSRLMRRALQLLLGRVGSQEDAVQRLRHRVVQLARQVLPLLVSRLDRKSTRLNSSHVAISYAVFCLKK